MRLVKGEEEEEEKEERRVGKEDYMGNPPRLLNRSNKEKRQREKRKWESKKNDHRMSRKGKGTLINNGVEESAQTPDLLTRRSQG